MSHQVTLRKHDFALDGANWDLSTLSLKDAPVEQLKKNTKATKIDLSNNLFTLLPNSFTTLTHIVWLDLSKNKLKQLPQQFGDLVKLQHVDLYGNELSQLPASFARLTRLKWLDLKQNPLEGQLKKVAGDCANAKQCQDCANRVVKYIKNENAKMEREEQELEMKNMINLENERKKMELKKIEKEKKKAKLARKAARKAQEKLNSDGLDVDEDESDSKKEGKVEVRSSKGFFGELIKLFLLLINVVFVLMLLTLASGIALHLHAGNRLESMNDVIFVTRNSFIKLIDLNTFLRDVGVMFRDGLGNMKLLFNDVIGNEKNISGS